MADKYGVLGQPGDRENLKRPSRKDKQLRSAAIRVTRDLEQLTRQIKAFRDCMTQAHAILEDVERMVHHFCDPVINTLMAFDPDIPPGLWDMSEEELHTLAFGPNDIGLDNWGM